MACGRAVVATRAGGLPEAVEHERTGLLVPVRDQMALAAAIRRLLEDAALRERFVRAGRTRVDQEFSVEQLVSGTLGVYEARLRARREAGDRPPG
jgi:glycosyltransferase involved in cell wall biosynthesis